MRKTWSVEKGQRYVQRPAKHNTHAIWEVGAIKTGHIAIPHARLVSVDDPLRFKTISCETLSDPSFYELLREAPGPA